MSFNEIIMWIVAIGVVIGGIDKILGNKLGIGKKLDEGINSFGGLALAMVGIMVMAPVIAKWILPILEPICEKMHIDPAMTAVLIANDTGGYAMAMILAKDIQIGLMAGCVTSAMLGCTLTFSIPVGLGIIKGEDREYFIRGIVIGLITIPIGSIVGGITAGFDFTKVIINNIPIIIFSMILVISIKKAPKKTIKIVEHFGTFIGWVATIGLVVGTFTYLTGIKFNIFAEAEDILEAMKAVVSIVLVLCGILPMMELLQRLFHKPLSDVGKLLEMDTASISGMIINLANPVPVFAMFKNMNKRGKVINAAWIVSAATAFGDHLGFTASMQPNMIKPMIIGKLTAGLCAVIIAFITTKSWNKI